MAPWPGMGRVPAQGSACRKGQKLDTDGGLRTDTCRAQANRRDAETPKSSALLHRMEISQCGGKRPGLGRLIPGVVQGPGSSGLAVLPPLGCCPGVRLVGAHPTCAVSAGRGQTARVSGLIFRSRPGSCGQPGPVTCSWAARSPVRTGTRYWKGGGCRGKCPPWSPARARRPTSKFRAGLWGRTWYRLAQVDRGLRRAPGGRDLGHHASL